MTSGAAELATAAVIGGLLRSALGGSLFVGAVWLACRAFPRLSPALRFGLYWLACARLAAGLVFAVPVAISVRVPEAFVVRPTAHRAVPTVARPADFGGISLPVGSAPAPGAARGSADAGPGSEASSAAQPARIRFAAPSWPQALAILWGLGVAAALALGLRKALLLRRLLRTASVIALPACTAEMGRVLGLRRLPEVRISDAVAGPLVAGLWRPIVVLPARFAEALTDDELRLTIAHEMAHIRRGDLWLGLIPALARALFFFHPLAYMAERECVAAREECCDALVVAATGASPARYGRFLVAVVAAQCAAAPRLRLANEVGAMGMAAAAFRPLQRRLLALGRPAGSATIGRSGAIGLAVAVAGALPLQIVAARMDDAARLDQAAAAPQRYRLVDLGTLGGQSSNATAIANDGAVVGGSNYNPHVLWGHAFVTGAAGALRDLSPLTPYQRGIARGVNDRGQVVVEAFTTPGKSSALLIDPATGAREMGALPGLPHSRPFGISAAGEVVGVTFADRPDPRGALPARAFAFRKGVVVDLGTLGGAYSQANAVNDAGWVAGKADLPTADDGTVTTHAFLGRDGGALQDIGTLPGGRNSVATAIDAAQRVAGTSDTADGARHAFIYTRGAIHDLGTLPGFASTHALGMNDHGLVVGEAAVAGATVDFTQQRAVLWQIGADGKPLHPTVDLNDLLPPSTGWTLVSARGVNDRGQIVGQGWYNGRLRAFLLNPVAPR